LLDVGRDRRDGLVDAHFDIYYYHTDDSEGPVWVPILDLFEKWQLAPDSVEYEGGPRIYANIEVSGHDAAAVLLAAESSK
jgi:hypothetical protein